jgi:hypothetical protein
MTRRVGSRVARKWPAAVFLLVLPFSASGCIWLAVPSLAYSGYKYEKKQDTPQSSSQSKRVSSKHTSTKRSSSKLTNGRSSSDDSSIE